jgi:inosose dehydratase
MAPLTHPPEFRFGCEVYTWFMKENGRAHANRLEHIIQVASQAGFRGIEPIHFWMGDLADPVRLAESLSAHGVELASIALVLEWNHDGETDQERQEADRVMDLVVRFPGAMLCTVQAPTGRADLVDRRLRLVRNLNSVARRAAQRGIKCSFHPNSPSTSIARTQEDYAVLLRGLDAEVIGWTPDVGHIANGGMDPLQTMREYAELINLIHYKDWDGEPEFALMGAGKVDFLGITRWLRHRDYSGWIICEDEGHAAVDDPDGTTLRDGDWVHKRLLPLL